MHTTNLRKVGGSIMMVIPPAVLDLLGLRAGATVDLSIEQGRLVIEPQKRARYSLEELLAQCDASIEPSEEDRQWARSPPVGRELI